jgi:hypothetical protein
MRSLIVVFQSKDVGLFMSLAPLMPCPAEITAVPLSRERVPKRAQKWESVKAATKLEA